MILVVIFIMEGIMKKWFNVWIVVVTACVFNACAMDLEGERVLSQKQLEAMKAERVRQELNRRWKARDEARRARELEQAAAREAENRRINQPEGTGS